MAVKASRSDVGATTKQLNGRQAQLMAAFMESGTLSLADCENLFWLQAVGRSWQIAVEAQVLWSWPLEPHLE